MLNLGIDGVAVGVSVSFWNAKLSFWNASDRRVLTSGG